MSFNEGQARSTREKHILRVITELSQGHCIRMVHSQDL